jgi:hypothetical protein
VLPFSSPGIHPEGVPVGVRNLRDKSPQSNHIPSRINNPIHRIHRIDPPHHMTIHPPQPPAAARVRRPGAGAGQCVWNCTPRKTMVPTSGMLIISAWRLLKPQERSSEMGFLLSGSVPLRGSPVGSDEA